MAVHPVALAEPFDDPFGDVADLLRFSGRSQHDLEFVAAETGDKIVGL